MALVLVSAFFGVAVALVFKWTSNQTKLRHTVDLCRAQILAIKLFKDEPKTIVVSLGRLMLYTLQRIWYLVPSVIAILVPTIVLLIQLATWYEYRPLVEGESAVVEIQLTGDAWNHYSDIQPKTPSQLENETPSLRDREQKSVSWRIRAVESAPAVLVWQLGAETIEKEVAITDRPEMLSPVSVRRPSSGWFDRLLNPVERPLAKQCPAVGIAVHHPKRSTLVFGWDIPWWLTMLVVSMVAAILVRPVFKVQF